MIPPGSTIGILGGGQLGRMLGQAAAQLGYHVHVYAPEGNPSAADAARAVTRAEYEDQRALAAFAESVDIVTFEFENVPCATLEKLAASVPVYPPAAALGVTQDRLAEKAFVRKLGGCTAPYAQVDSREDLSFALTSLGAPAILKTRRFGYDGKGQARLASPADIDAAWAAIGQQSAILEGMVEFDAEFSILLARGQDGAERCWAAPHNVHKDGILDSSTVPAPGPIHDQAPVAADLAGNIADALDYVGVLACEFFATANGPVFNEMAPRVHNSGHWTIEGAVTSQFENHIRAICGLPLGQTALAASKVTMHNLIGEDAGRWKDILSEPGAHLHLYGKGEARPGRKMGHVTRLYR
ncbi:5-(carboxyamino)imidazole ribonucleotide synthase [Sphingomonas sp. ID0503]|uniref:5-(carboxyamino)imidazole ribonucleotide synthase n=1 Tax=Sphingomonas sp. ID0503 TaxID=3399691 RepID=UPI003AFA5B2F